MSSGPSAATPQIPGVDLLEVIGSGGSGVVYRGRQRAFGRDVAVKVVRNVEDGNGGATNRWEREVAAVGRLSNHPNIVPVFDAGITEDGSPYIVMPHVPKGSLGDRLRQEGPLGAEEVASIGARLADALATVHAAGILHRDVKPDNVLWSPHGEPQLTDFGIARLEDLTTTSDGALQATISYAAPEVLAGEPATEASDIYGLAATLYACLTGASPHPSTGGENVAVLVARVLEEEPPSLRARGVPAGLAVVIEQAMSRNPTARQSDATRFRHDLERASDAPPATAALPHEATTRFDPTTLAGTAAVPAASAPRSGVVVPAPLREPDPVHEQRRDRPVAPGPGGGNRVLWAAIAVVLLLAGGTLLVANMGDDAATTATTETTVEPTTSEAPAAASEDTSPPTTDAAATATRPAPSTTPSDDDDEDSDEDEEDARPAAAAGDPGGTAVEYLRTLDRDELDEAWAMTSKRFQSSQDRRSWERFWGGRDVRIVGDPRVERGGAIVIVPLTYEGSREDYRLEMVRRGDRWLIDGPVGR